MNTPEAVTETLPEAWEVISDGTVEKVAVVSKYRNPFGYWRVRRSDGMLGQVYHVNLRANDNIDVRYTNMMVEA